jgi:hypothetical protein
MTTTTWWTWQLASQHLVDVGGHGLTHILIRDGELPPCFTFAGFLRFAVSNVYTVSFDMLRIAVTNVDPSSSRQTNAHGSLFVRLVGRAFTVVMVEIY